MMKYLNNNFFLSIIIILPFAFLSWVEIGKTFMGTDDANIYFIYMRNIFEGYGFVYQKGGENVEGFTSIIWTFLGALLNVMPIKIFYSLFFVNFLLITFLGKSFDLAMK